VRHTQQDATHEGKHRFLHSDTLQQPLHINAAAAAAHERCSSRCTSSAAAAAAQFVL
jgi:hypothetical protein